LNVSIGQYWLGLAAIVAGCLAAADPAAAATVSPPVVSDYLANPGIGFQAMHNLEAPVLPETVAYRRPQYGWNAQNPAEGVYDWSAIDADLAAAAALGKQFSFRIYTMRGESFGGHKVPDWVVAKGAVIQGGQPRYSNCIYQQYWADFVEQMRLRYDGNPDIAFLDISGYGNFNEWSWQNQTEWDDDFANPTTLDGMARRRLADMFLGGSGTIDCTLSGGGTQSVSYSYPGFQATQLVMPYAGIQQSTRYVASRRSDVGFREDCLGSPDHTDGMLESVGDVIATIWPNAPVVYELCGIEDLTSALEVLQTTHGSAVHENGGDNDLDGLRDLLRYSGYRFVLAEATFPDVSTWTGSIDVDMTWRNVGFAPAYAKTGQDFELRFYLLEAGGAVAASWTLPTDPNDWMPADPIGSAAVDNTFSGSLPLPPGLHLAQYTAAVGVFDLRTASHVKVANEGRDAEERLVLGTVVFGDGSVCGDGLLRSDLGEQCDDGNVESGDCCGPTCQAETGSCDDDNPCTTGETCSAATCGDGSAIDCDDGVACTTDSCEPAVGCTATPDDSACDDGIACTADVCATLTGCSHQPDDSLCDDHNLCTGDACNSSTLECEYSAAPQPTCDENASSGLVLSDANGKEKLSWKWKRGTIDAGTLGNPTPDGGTAYALCIYNGVGLAMSANMPAGISCGGGSSCWTVRDDRLGYTRSDATPDGISKARVRAGRAGRDSIQVKGRYSVLEVPDPALPAAMFDPALGVKVQAVNSDGACWGATFDAASIRTNQGDTFKASLP